MTVYRRVALIAAILALLIAMLDGVAHRYGLAAFALLFPVIAGAGVLVAWNLVHGMPEAVHELKAWAWRDLEGRYYEFEHRPMRVIEMDGSLWLHEDDVRAVLGSPRRELVELAAGQRAAISDDAEVHGPPCRVGECCLSLEAIERLGERRTDRTAGRLLHWFERDVLAPWQRKRGIEPRFMKPMEKIAGS